MRALYSSLQVLFEIVRSVGNCMGILHALYAHARIFTLTCTYRNLSNSIDRTSARETTMEHVLLHNT